MGRIAVRTLLIVEDDESFREMLRSVLETRGFNVLVAGNAGDGLALAACHEVDAVVTDYQMPRRNGLEFCRALHEQNAALDRQVPVWLMTGSLTLGIKEALAAGASGIFRKPFHAVELSRQIERRLKVATSAANLGF